MSRTLSSATVGDPCERERPLSRLERAGRSGATSARRLGGDPVFDVGNGKPYGATDTHARERVSMAAGKLVDAFALDAEEGGDVIGVDK